MKYFLFLICTTIVFIPNILGQQSVKHLQQILVYGSPPDPIYQNAEKIISKRWNIEIVAAGGCVVSEKMQDSISLFNNNAYAALAKMHGEDWQVRFYKEIDEEYKRELSIATILDNDVAVQKMLETHSDAYFTYEMFPVQGTTLYDIKVNNIETWEDRTSSVTYYKLRVDTDKKTVKVNNKTKQFNFAYE